MAVPAIGPLLVREGEVAQPLVAAEECRDCIRDHRASLEFRRAVSLINQGRLAEGLDALRAALRLDPGYDAVRQTLVALLIEGKRLDEAAAVLRDGLALDPSNAGFAMLLARVLVERNDVVVVTYSSINTNAFEPYGECVMGSKGTLVVEEEQKAML